MWRGRGNAWTQSPHDSRDTSKCTGGNNTCPCSKTTRARARSLGLIVFCFSWLCFRCVCVHASLGHAGDAFHACPFRVYVTTGGTGKRQLRARGQRERHAKHKQTPRLGTRGRKAEAGRGKLGGGVSVPVLAFFFAGPRPSCRSLTALLPTHMYIHALRHTRIVGLYVHIRSSVLLYLLHLHFPSPMPSSPPQTAGLTSSPCSRVRFKEEGATGRGCRC